MPKTALSVTLADQNLLWLKGRVRGGANRSLSDAIDAIVTAARTGGHGATPMRSVIGTVDVGDDVMLDEADAYVRSLFDRSITRPVVARETTPAYKTSRKSTTKRGRRG